MASATRVLRVRFSAGEGRYQLSGKMSAIEEKLKKGGRPRSPRTVMESKLQVRMMRGRRDELARHSGWNSRYDRKKDEWRRRQADGEMFMKLFRDNLGPYTEKDLLDLYTSRHTPEELKPPKALMETYIRNGRATIKHNWLLNGSTQSSFRSQAKKMGRYSTQGAQRLINEESHGASSSKFATLDSQHGGVRQAWSVAPVVYASSKAKYCFGKGAQCETREVALAPASIPPPHPDRPEVAFIGCSNRGQSSVINCMLNRILCGFGQQTGTTNGLHFISCGSKEGNLTVVDCAGWTTNTRMASRADMNTQLVKQYLETRGRTGGLKCVIFTVDVFSGIDYNDKLILSILAELEISFYIHVSRTDQGSWKGKSQFVQIVSFIEMEMESYPTCRGILLTSTLEKKGITRLQNVVANYSKIPELGMGTKSGDRMADILPATGFEKRMIDSDVWEKMSTTQRRWEWQIRQEKKRDEETDEVSKPVTILGQR
eukprot:TRINITY_DN1046_c0_g3_i1.p1 TRINITY_DN1046_c0_g3~~TRINITY_DN1046_c0_g3_i1.p1  ORF type:complete len:486 (+),score=118.85 TRINITY_DN1046_c0_g3_i1:55-1512(+)